jgi:hypothetical protein
VSDQARDEQGRFTGEPDTEPMNKLLRERRRFRMRVVDKPTPGNRAMNELLLRAAGRIPSEDDEAA